MTGRRALRPLILLWALAPFALGVAFVARLTIYKTSLGHGTKWRIVEGGGGPVPGSDAHQGGIQDRLADGTHLLQQLATVEVVGAQKTEAYPALLIELSAPDRAIKLKAVRSPYFGAQDLDLLGALQDSVGRDDEPTRLLEAGQHKGKVRMSFGGRSAYSKRSLVRAMVLEPEQADVR